MASDAAPLDADWARRWMRRTAEVMTANRAWLIELDRQIGDADHGENMHRGYAAVVAALDAANGDSAGLDAVKVSGAAGAVTGSVADVLKLAAMTLMSTVGGAAGPLYGTAFLRAAKAVADVPTGAALAPEHVTALLRAALDGVSARGKATPGEKTMVDAWAPAVDAATSAAAAGASSGEILAAAASAAEAGAVATDPLVATKGRASYLGERSAGHRDPGAASTALILRAAADSVADAATEPANGSAP